MPAIELRKDPYASMMALMAFPGDESMRRAFYAVQSTLKHRPTGNLEALTDDLLDAPSYADIRGRVANAMKRGNVAGYILATIYIMDRFALKEPSMKKAVFVVMELSKTFTYKDGSRLPRGKTEIRECWNEYSHVAHLWAVMLLHQQGAISIGPDNAGLRDPAGIPDFLGYSAAFQDFGCGFVARRTVGTSIEQPLLPRELIWSISDSAERLYPSWVCPPDWLTNTLRSYRA